MAPIEPPYLAPVAVTPDIYMLQVPIPIPLRYVNCYLLRGPSGWTLVDAGFRDHLSEDAWQRAFADLGIRAQDVDRILVTHYHPDHLGAAGWLQEWTGAPAYMHEPELEQVELFWGGGTWNQGKALRTFFAAEGMPEEMASAIEQHHGQQSANVKPLVKLQPLPTGSQVRLGTADYEVIWAPGHSDGLAIFWNAETGLLVANDMILAKITPNVSLWPRSRPNPLQDYLSSLGLVEALQARLALTGHRQVIENVSERAAEIRRHHAERLNKMERLCDGARGATAWEVCEQVFRPAELTIHQVRFAMAETLAHLVYMDKQGRLLRKGNRFVQA